MPFQAGLINALGSNLVRGYFVNQVVQGNTEGPIAVTSSNIQSIAYNYDKNALLVTFLRKPGSPTPSSYVYFNVPSNLWEEFKRAPSFGKFLNTYIKERFQFDRLS